MRKKLTIIANPFSGTSQKQKLKDQIFKINNDFFDISFLYTERPSHAKELVNKAIANKAEIIVAIGGDGTVNEVASEIAVSPFKDDVTLGILPAGSGNGFAMHLGLGRDPIKAFEFIKKGKTTLVDTCYVNDKFFINVSGIGFDARVAYLTKKSSSRGFKRYFITTMRELNNFSTVKAKITTDKGIFEGNYAAIIIANATMYGYNFTVAPSAALDDGLLDVVLLKEAPIISYALNSYRFLTKTLDKSPFAETIQSSFVKVECEKQDYFHVDGEGFLMDGCLEFGIKQKQLRVIANK